LEILAALMVVIEDHQSSNCPSQQEDSRSGVPPASEEKETVN